MKSFAIVVVLLFANRNGYLAEDEEAKSESSEAPQEDNKEIAKEFCKIFFGWFAEDKTEIQTSDVEALFEFIREKLNTSFSSDTYSISWARDENGGNYSIEHRCREALTGEQLPTPERIKEFVDKFRQAHGLLFDSQKEENEPGEKNDEQPEEQNEQSAPDEESHDEEPDKPEEPPASIE